MGNLFELAELQLIKEGKVIYSDLELLDRAVKIRRWLDIHRGIGDKILAGVKVWQRGNRFVYNK